MQQAQSPDNKAKNKKHAEINRLKKYLSLTAVVVTSHFSCQVQIS